MRSPQVHWNRLLHGVADARIQAERMSAGAFAAAFGPQLLPEAGAAGAAGAAEQSPRRGASGRTAARRNADQPTDNSSVTGTGAQLSWADLCAADRGLAQQAFQQAVSYGYYAEGARVECGAA